MLIKTIGAVFREIFNLNTFFSLKQVLAEFWKLIEFPCMEVI